MEGQKGKYNIHIYIYTVLFDTFLSVLKFIENFLINNFRNLIKTSNKSLLDKVSIVDINKTIRKQLKCHFM